MFREFLVWSRARWSFSVDQRAILFILLNLIEIIGFWDDICRSEVCQLAIGCKIVSIMTLPTFCVAGWQC